MPAEAQDAGNAGGAGAPQGLSWSWELDFGALIAALAGTDPADADSSGSGPSTGDPSGAGGSATGSPSGAGGSATGSPSGAAGPATGSPAGVGGRSGTGGRSGDAASREDEEAAQQAIQDD